MSISSTRRNLRIRAILPCGSFTIISGYDGKYIFDYPPVTRNKDLAVGKWWGAESTIRPG